MRGCDVIERQPPPRAVALRWEERGAPRITAKGSADVATRILALAAKHGVPLREDPALVEVLSRVDLGRQIPENLFRAVAEVIAFAYSLRDKTLKPSQEITSVRKVIA